MTLEASIRSEATRLGVDLLGIAPVSRWDKAPKEHSPQAVMPEARNVIVCGIHFLDAPTELGAEDDPREPGPAMTEMNVSHMLHEVAWSLCKLLDRQGHRANFVRQSGQWRYRASGEDRGWVGDICHYYAAVCAGLGEVGWNNITLSEKFGPRQRWVSIITDADLPPTPLYDGPPLCDRCKLCAKHCPTQSFTKDVSGEMRHIEVERHRYEFPDRNLWRCAIGENFMLDVFLDKWKDQEVTEDLIKAMQEKAVYENNDMVKGWKMGMCLKHCMPPHRRYFDPDYCKAPRRRRDVQVDPSPAALARAQQDILAHAGEWGVDMIAAASAEALTEAGIDLREVMPDAESLLVLGIGYPAQCMLNSDYVAAKAEIMVAKMLQEQYGYSTLPRTDLDPETCAVAAGLARPVDKNWQTDSRVDADLTRGSSLRLDSEDSQIVSDRFGHHQIWRTIITSAPFEAFRADTTPPAVSPIETTSGVSDAVRNAARAGGADLVGIAPADRIADLAPPLQDIFAEADYFVVEDTTIEPLLEVRKQLWGAQAYPFTPVVHQDGRQPKTPADYLAEATSVIVLGVGLLDASVDVMASGEALKAGHFHTTVHEEPFSQLATAMLKVTRVLDRHGARSTTTRDLMGLASRVSGADVDLTASRFAALAAGLGELGLHGLVLTPQFGSRQRFACIITDAELDCDEIYRGDSLCLQCGECLEACPVKALAGETRHSIQIDGRKFTWADREQLRCDISQRYGLIGAAGGSYSGCRNNVDVPQTITPEYVVECMKAGDRVQRPGYTPIVQRCFTHCRAHATEPSAQTTCAHGHPQVG